MRAQTSSWAQWPLKSITINSLLLLDFFVWRAWSFSGLRDQIRVTLSRLCFPLLLLLVYVLSLALFAPRVRSVFETEWRRERRASGTINTIIRNWCKAVEQQGADGAWMLRQFPYISCPAGGLRRVVSVAVVCIILPPAHSALATCLKPSCCLGSE